MPDKMAKATLAITTSPAEMKSGIERFFFKKLANPKNISWIRRAITKRTAVKKKLLKFEDMFPHEEEPEELEDERTLEALLEEVTMQAWERASISPEKKTKAKSVIAQRTSPGIDIPKAAFLFILAPLTQTIMAKTEGKAMTKSSKTSPRMSSCETLSKSIKA